MVSNNEDGHGAVLGYCYWWRRGTVAGQTLIAFGWMRAFVRISQETREPRREEMLERSSNTPFGTLGSNQKGKG